MEITKSLLFCSLYHGVLKPCFGTALGLFECSLHSCTLSGPVDLLSSMLASLRETVFAPHSIFMPVHSLAHRFVNDCSFAEWDLLLSGDIPLKSPHGRCGHLWLVSPDYCPCHPSPQMCFHTYPGLYFDTFWLQCAGEPSADLPWPGQRSNEVCCLSNFGKWMLLSDDQNDSLSFQTPIILHNDTQLHKIHSSIIQTSCSLPASLFLSAVWLSCLFVCL